MDKNRATQHSLDRLRKDERFMLVERVEQFVSFPPPGHRRDMFGLLDIVAVGPGITLGVQVTTLTQFNAHRRKIEQAPETRILLAAGWLIELHGWHKPKHRWEVRVHWFELDPRRADGNQQEEPDPRAVEV